MSDHDLGDLLRELPRERAGGGFTARVLAGLDDLDGRPGPPAWRRFRLAPAAIVAVVAIVASAGLLQIRADRQEDLRTAEARRILQELRDEHRRLERELELLSHPVVYLGGTEDMDLVVDLSRLQGAAF